MHAARGALLALLGALAAGCASQAHQRLVHYGQQFQGRFQVVERADFPSGAAQDGAQGAIGSQVLATAAAANPHVDGVVRAQGVPDAIALGPYGSPILLAYLGPAVLYTVRLDGFFVPTWVVDQRPLSDDEVNYIDPERRTAALAELLRELLAAHARVQTVGRRMLSAMTPPPGSPPGTNYGVLLVRATPGAARLLGGDADPSRKIVAWIDPDGPAAGRLQVGDHVTAVDGADPIALDSAGTPWQGAKRLSLLRAGAPLEVTLAPETWPQDVGFTLIPEPVPNAAAGPGAVAVTSGMVALCPSDDALAWVIGHELAHIQLGHVERPVTPGSVLKGLVSVGVLLPAELVVPGTGRLLGSAMQGVEDRFNRDQERDADRLGVHLAHRAGYDASAAAGMMEAFEAVTPPDDAPGFFDIHPPYPERRQLIDAELRTLTPAP